MRSGIHPSFFQTTVTCACGNAFSIGTTIEHAFRVEACYLCHPFYTGKQKLVDTAGRVDRFRQRAQAAKRITEEKGKHRVDQPSLKNDVITKKPAPSKKSLSPNASPVNVSRVKVEKPVPVVKKASSPKKASLTNKKSVPLSPKKAKK